MSMNGFLDRVMCVFFPRRCKYCGEVILPSEQLCEDCREHLPRIETPVCNKCGKSKSDCVCKGRSGFYSFIAAPFYYEDAITKAVARFKFQHRLFLGDVYAEDMAECLRERRENLDYDCICYVPFCREDKKRREFNHSEVLARGVSERIGVRVSDALVRIYSSRVQHTLKLSGRTGNVFAVFDVSKPEEIRDKNVLLIDDIKTTGSTLNECAKMLMIHGARRVDCLTFAVGRGKQDIDNGE